MKITSITNLFNGSNQCLRYTEMGILLLQNKFKCDTIVLNKEKTMLLKKQRTVNNSDSQRLVQNEILKLEKCKATSSVIALPFRNILFA